MPALTLADILSRSRQLLSEPTPQLYSDEFELIPWINEEHTFIGNKLALMDKNYFYATSFVSTTAGTFEYRFPIRLDRLTGMRYYENGTDNDDDSQGSLVRIIHRTDIDDIDWPYLNLGSIGANNSAKFYAVIDRDGFSIFPEPTSSETNAIKLYFSRYVGELSSGFIESSTTTTLTLTDQPTHGNTILDDDYYNDMFVKITKGTGAGQIKKVTDYVGSTRVLTVESAWTTQPDSTSFYSFIAEMPHGHHEILIYGTVLRARMKRDDGDIARYDFIRQRYSDLWDMLSKHANERQLQRPRYVKRRESIY